MTGAVGLPAVPVVAEEELTAYASAQSVVAMAFDELDEPLRVVAGELFFAIGTAALAALTPSLAGLAEPPLFPAPRAFLSAADRARLEGSARALDHVSARKHRVRTGVEPRLLRPETPYVVHALAEGCGRGPFETSPGSLRTTDTRWRDADDGYRPPDAATAASILPVLIEAAAAEQPGPVVGAWLAFTLMSVHPFVDGNGRTARLLYLLLSSLAVPTFVDVGVVEQLVIDRRGYVETLQAGQRPAGSYRPERLDAGPFTRFMIRSSVLGADRSVRRLRALQAAGGRLTGFVAGLSDGQRSAALRVWLERVLAPEQLMEPVVDEAGWSARAEAVAPLEELVAAGVLERLALPPSRRRPGWRGVGYRLTPVVIDAVGEPLATSA